MRFLKWLDDVNYNYSWVRCIAWLSWMWGPFAAYFVLWLIYGNEQPGYIAGPACVGSVLGGFVLYWISFDRSAKRLERADPVAYDEWLAHPY